MDNQQSSPQIIFPNVPDDFCPTGNWQEILQEFIDIVLSNGTINVPGLGDVTPEQIAEIQAELQDQQNQIDAIPDNIIEFGEVAVTSTDAQYAVLLPTTMPDTNYGIVLTPVSATGQNPTARCYLVNGTKSVGGFSFMVEAAEIHTTFVQWMAIHSTN